MKADILSPNALFQKQVRYVIPTFQRPYVWTQDKQWDPLWDDIQNTAERYLDALADGDGNQAQAAAKTPNHFLGAVVLQQQPTPTIAIETRLVIDGQQRLTTLQLLVDAAQEVLEDLECTAEARRLSKLVLNDADFVGDEPDDAFKIWPTTGDRDAFRRAMHSDMDPGESADSNILQAHEFFQLQVRQWLEQIPEQLSRRAHALETTLVGLIDMVVIDLGLDDDPNVIFETLNDRGTSLLASDLVKNFILHSARESGLNSELIYNKQWKHFDERWWRVEVRQGRIVHPRLDVFLNYWLMTATGSEVPATDVFRVFRDHLAERRPEPLDATLAEIGRFGATYRMLDSEDGVTGYPLQFLHRWKVMDAGVVTPVLLWLFSRPTGAIPPPALKRGLQAIESFLVRRMASRLTTKDYNRLFLEMLARLKGAEPQACGDVIVDYLRTQTADARVWPDDVDFEFALSTLPLYRLLTRGRLRMILETIEFALRDEMAETQVVPTNLSIEHVLPQGWRDHWAIIAESDDDYVALARDRDRLLHSLGNLTLVKGRLNSKLSNAAWVSAPDANGLHRDKRRGLEDHSVLYLNKALLVMASETWDEAMIHRRAKILFQTAASIWPGPNAF